MLTAVLHGPAGSAFDTFRAVRAPRYRQSATPTRLGHRRALPPPPRRGAPLPLPPAAPTPRLPRPAPAAAAAAAAARGRPRIPAGELHGGVRLGDGAGRAEPHAVGRCVEADTVVVEPLDCTLGVVTATISPKDGREHVQYVVPARSAAAHASASADAAAAAASPGFRRGAGSGPWPRIDSS